MFAILSVRFAGVMGLVCLALFTTGLVTFPSFPTTGAGLFAARSALTVNRALKGDRLPVVRPDASPQLGSPASPARELPQTQIPVGCDHAFSPISSPALAHVFRRCMA